MKKKNCALSPVMWIAGLVCIHLILWTLLPTFTRHNLPLDAMEGATWGQQWQLGYDKNPFMNAWLTQIAYYLGGQSGWMIYLFSQLSVSACFLAIWRLARDMLHPLHALLAVFFLEGILYYTLYTDAFNDNVLEIGFWAWLSVNMYLALKHHRMRYWVGIGIFAALAMMSKYYVLMLLGCFLLLLLQRPYRQYFKQAGPYVSAAIFILICLPHVYWLTQHDYMAIAYVFVRTGQHANSWLNHFTFPCYFLWQQLAKLVLPVALLGVFYWGRKTDILTPKRYAIATGDQYFLWFIGVMPLVLTVLLSVVTGIRLHANWGQPLLNLSGIITVAYLQPAINKTRWWRYIFTLSVAILLLAAGYITHQYTAGARTKSNYPGDKLSQVVFSQWQHRYPGKTLHFVVGDRWVAGNVAYYTPDKLVRPDVFIDANTKVSPWIDTAALKRDGAVFLFPVRNGKVYLPPGILQHYPRLTAPYIVRLPWYRPRKRDKLLEVGVAFLPPR